MALHFSEALSFWGTPYFDEAFKRSLMQQATELPLQQALSVSSSVADAPITVVVLRAEALGAVIRVRAGIFYEGEVGGCSCAGDPAPETVNTEHCVLLLDIDRSTGEASCQLEE